MEEGNYNTQTFTQVEDDAGTSTGRETQNLAATDIHVKRLSDFINNRDAENQNRNDMHLPELETESVPQKFDSEMGGTEELIGWRDPSEFTQEARTKVKQMKHVGTPRFSMSCSDDQVSRKKLIEESINFGKCGRACLRLHDSQALYTAVLTCYSTKLRVPLPTSGLVSGPENQTSKGYCASQSAS